MSQAQLCLILLSLPCVMRDITLNSIFVFSLLVPNLRPGNALAPEAHASQQEYTLTRSRSFSVNWDPKLQLGIQKTVMPEVFCRASRTFPCPIFPRAHDEGMRTLPLPPHA